MSLLPEEALRELVLGVSGVSASINGNYGAEQVRQESKPPFIVARVQEGKQIGHFTGESGHWTGVINLFIVGGESYETARSIGEAIRKALNFYKGSVTKGGDTEQVGYLACENEESASYDPGDGAGKLTKAWQQDWRMTITQPTS
jgi:hypothetical protein